VAETRVDLLHLLEDLRDAYPGAIEETILTEIIANSLDSGASRIRIEADPVHATLTVSDNGSGMPRRDLRRYHDLAASTKTKGQGIGFAGVGIKLALLVCKEVVTETRHRKAHIATTWHFASRHRAPWKWIVPAGLVAEQGTAVKLHLADSLSPLTDRGYIEAAVRRHYQPLLDPACEPQLAAIYRHDLVFEVNGERLPKRGFRAAETAALEIHVGRKRKPSAMGYLYREPVVLPEDQQGVAVSTYGKIIKRGWDWLGISPRAPECTGGLIEAPALAGSLTLNKGDFIRTGGRGAAYLAFRKAMQEVVMRQLAAWGDGRDEQEAPRPRSMRALERDLERVLMDLSEGFPLVASLVEQRRGGQKRLPLAPNTEFGDESSFGGALASRPSQIPPNTDETPAKPELEPRAKEPEVPRLPTQLESTAGGTALPEPRAARRPIKLGLAVQFEERPDDSELGRLVESTVFINRAHPAYERAAASRSEGYHIALSVALALAPLAVEPAREHGFVTAFLSRWGEAASGRPSRRRRR
jgi:Histidine kinase-, DNA gyrase B-, and HSP90-like ATPase